MKKIKILMILDNLNKCDGIASYVMNYYKNINLNKFQIDFLISKSDNGVNAVYKEMIEKSGGKVILKHNVKNTSIVKEIKNINKLFKENNYDIIHSHIINMGYFYLKYARKNGIKVRILHSHTTFLWSKNIFTHIRNLIFTKLAIRNANCYFACSELAGNALFKRKKFTLIKNAIDIEQYKFNNKIRKLYREKLNLKDNIVYGHIGRFNIQKNHDFLLKVFEEIYNSDRNSRLLLVGKGELENEIIAKIRESHLEEVVTILGEREDVSNLLQAMDIFLLPSLFEGLPIVGIEAQASGLPCYFSEKITQEVKMLETTKFIEIKEPQKWKNLILNDKVNQSSRNNEEDNIKEAGYEIKSATKKLEEIYNKLVMENK